MAASPDRVCIVDVGDDDVGDLAPGTNETPGAKLTTLQKFLDSLGRPRVRVAVVGVRPVRMGVAQLGVPVFVRMSPLDGRVA